MAAITLGKVKPEFRGAWSVSTTYYIDDVVTYDGAMYVVISESSVVGQSPLVASTKGWEKVQQGAGTEFNSSGDYQKYELNATYWARFGPEVQFGEYKGEWSASTTYYPGEVVKRTYGPDDQFVCSYYSRRINRGDDPFWNLGGGWEVFIEGGSGRSHRRITRLFCQQPIGWRGHPNLTMPQWGTSDAWQGNIPWDMSAAGSKEYYNDTTAMASPGRQGSLTAIDWYGNGISIGGLYYGAGGYEGTDNASQTAMAHHQPMHYTDFAKSEWQSHPWYTGNQNRLDGTKIDINDPIVEDPDFQLDYNNFLQTRDMHLNFLGNRSTPRVISTPAHYGATFLFDDGTLQIGGVNSSSQYTGDHTSWYASGAFLGKDVFGGKRLVKVVGGSSDNTNAHFIALDEEGEIWCWGENSQRECGIGPENGVSGRGDLGMGYDDNTDVRQPIMLNTELCFEGNKIVDVWAIYGNSAALDDAGNLWTWGDNTDGQLGYATVSGFTSASYCAVPKKINVNWNTYAGIQKIMWGGATLNSSLWVLDGQGQIWNCGYNSQGILGSGNTTNTGTSGTLTRRTGWSGLSGSIVNFWVVGYGSYMHNCFFRKSDGTLWGVGDNSEYQLDTGNTTDQYTPVQLNSITNPVKVHCIVDDDNETHSGIAVLDEDGAIWNLGSGSNFRSGHGYTGDNASNESRIQFSGKPRYSGHKVPVPRGVLQEGVRDVFAHGAYWGQGGGTYSTRPCYILGNDGSFLVTGQDQDNSWEGNPTNVYSAGGFGDHHWYGK
jgi:hypothetical protein